jgi:hypothetical protein
MTGKFYLKKHSHRNSKNTFSRCVLDMMSNDVREEYIVMETLF